MSKLKKSSVKKCDCKHCKIDIHTNKYMCLRIGRKFVDEVIITCEYINKKVELKKYAKHCAYCGKYIPWSQRTVDHITPKKYGGDYGLGNLIICCRECNIKKGSMPLREFRKIVDNDVLISYLNQFVGKDLDNYIYSMLCKFKLDKNLLEAKIEEI